MKKNYTVIISTVMILGLLTGCNSGSSGGSDVAPNTVIEAPTTQSIDFDASGDWYVTTEYESNTSEEPLELPYSTTITIEQTEGANSFIAHIFGKDIEGSINENEYTLTFPHATTDGQSIPITVTLVLENETIAYGSIEGVHNGLAFTYEILADKIDPTEETVYAD